VISSLEVDETNRSYYGESQVHIMTVNCEGFMVHRDKEGPVHTFTWNPNGTNFALCYGFMPAKVFFSLILFFDTIPL
jgi:translation initiation factor 2A